MTTVLVKTEAKLLEIVTAAVGEPEIDLEHAMCFQLLGNVADMAAVLGETQMRCLQRRDWSRLMNGSTKASSFRK